jgi:glycine cleavage system aminomethyltransferase T
MAGDYLLCKVILTCDAYITALTRKTGPRSAAYLQCLTSFDLRRLTFGKSAFVPLEGFNLHVARGGYTGEDGFEVRSAFLSI